MTPSPSTFGLMPFASISWIPLDTEERNLQVLRMTAIYRGAFDVVAWLGLEEPDVPSTLRKLNALAEYPPDIQKSRLRRVHFKDLFSRQYWRRIWMIQEISVAPTITVACGTQRMSWDTLCNYLNMLKEKISKGRPCPGGSRTKKSNLNSPHWQVVSAQYHYYLSAFCIPLRYSNRTC